jgi:ABC-type transport system substrate-binding protein
MSHLHRFPRFAAVALLVAIALAWAGCMPSPRVRPTTFAWVVGKPAPTFDPQAPPDEVRWGLERLLSHGLVDEDSSSRIVPAAAESIEISDDRLTVTFRLRPKLTFVDGTPCGSEDFRAALEAGLTRPDHVTQAWLLSSVQGVERVRPGQRQRPAVGIETPDSGTLVLHLVRPDSLLLRKLALPGVGVPWRVAAPDSGPGPGWTTAVGLGPYRVVREDPGHMLLLARARGQRTPAASSAPDSILVRFVFTPARALALLRGGDADLVWPVPTGFSEFPLPVGCGEVERPASPERRLLLVMRPDRPPTSKPEAREALAHALNHEELVQALGDSLADSPWLTGAPPFDFPALNPEAVRTALSRGEFGRSLHVLMSYDADGPAAEVASVMQGQWAGLGLYIDLRALRGQKLAAELLEGGSHLLLVESQPLLDHVSAELAALVMPARGPGVGEFRTMWRTRDFDPWLAPRPAARSGARGPSGSPSALPDSLQAGPAQAQQLLAGGMVVLPLAHLPWLWVERGGPLQVGFHPHFGPQCLPTGPR